MATYCRFHCTSCGRHFSSLKAFDAHRRGDHEVERFCAHPAELETPEGEPLLRIKDDETFCRLRQTGKTFKCKLWEYAPDADAARERFAALEAAKIAAARPKKRKRR